MTKITGRLVPLLVLVALGSACGGGDDAAARTTVAADADVTTTTAEATTTTEAEATTTTEAEVTTTTLPPLPDGHTYGVFDLNDDHVGDEMCEPQDFGAGLVL